MQALQEKRGSTLVGKKKEKKKNISNEKNKYI